jgi:leucine dehydrogenase
MNTFETIIKQWDGESVVVRHDRPSGAWIFIAVHSTRLGPATGGTRMRQYGGLEDALRDVLRLAEGMTYKWAVPGFERGGGKAVIAVPGELDAETRSGLLRRYGELVHQLGGLFYTGPDVGTSPEDMDAIAETGAPYVHSRTPSAGGAGSSGPFTALGVFTGIQVACEHLFGAPSLDGRRVLVQGVGSVGRKLIEYLGGAGAEVVISDVDEDAVKRCRDELGLGFVPPGDVYATACDVFAPCALGGILNADNIPRLECRAVVGGANNQLSSPEDAEALKRRNILYTPDYVVNVGGALGITGMEAMDWSQEEATNNVVESVRNALRRILSLSAEEGITTEAAARRIAEENLSRGAQ